MRVAEHISKFRVQGSGFKGFFVLVLILVLVLEYAPKQPHNDSRTMRRTRTRMRKGRKQFHHTNDATFNGKDFSSVNSVNQSNLSSHLGVTQSKSGNQIPHPNA